MKRLSLGIVGLLLLAGCQSETFEQQVTRLREGYTISSSGFVVKQTPPPVAPSVMPQGAAMADDAGTGEEPAVEGEAAAAQGEAAEGESAEGETMEGADGIQVEELLPVKQDVLLDLLVRHDNVRGSLPVLTLDIAQVDTAGNEKAHWRAAIDTSGISRGPGVQLTHELADVEFEEGDTFEVEVRNPVPPAERGEYAEFTPSE